MSRGAVLVLLGLVPLARAVVDACDAAADLAQRAGLTRDGHAVTRLGDWELGVLVGRGIGLGFVADHLPAGCGVVEPARTEALVYLGPITLTASRERLGEVAPLVGTGAAA